MFDRWFKKTSHDIGIDLGTSNTLVFIQDRGVVINEASVVAVNTRAGQILAVGREALKMQGKTPAHLQVIQPLVDGVISDFEVAEKMLKYFFDRVHREHRMLTPRPRVVIGIPLDVTEVEKKAVEDAVMSAGAREVHLVQTIVAAAVGARLPIQDASGNMLVDCGGGVTQVAVISLSGVVASKSLRVAGSEVDVDIMNYARHEFNLLVGERVAEEAKLYISRSKEGAPLPTVKLRGRDLLTGLPREIGLSGEQMVSALRRSLKSIVDGIKSTLEVTPPELVADIYQRGITLVGGGASLLGLREAIVEATKMKVIVVDDPMTCAVRGMGLLLEDAALLREISIPSSQNDDIVR
ncbi:MAG: rod shape-determining protein MreB [Parcubacteria group bacterium Gr01-1014_31]|nr:MAG: rod shape-determining protein MreB [Parcubacteria group bacterium Gr01-1014_31]